MKRSFLTKFLSLRDLANKKLPICPILPKSTPSLVVEPLEARLLLSVLNYADELVDEVEPNDVSPGQELIFEEGTLAIGVPGVLADGSDVDVYNFSIEEGGQIDLLLEITQGGDQELVALAVGADDRVRFIAENGVWQQNPEGSQSLEFADILADRDDIAVAAGLNAEEVILTDLAVTANGLVLITLSGCGDVFSIDSDHNITQILTTEDVTAVTGESVDLVSIAIDGDGEIYLADQHSGSILQVSAPAELGGAYSVAFYTRADELDEVMREELFRDLNYGITSMPTTVIAESQDDSPFAPNSLIQGGGAYSQDGYDVYYIGQLGPAFDGNGAINRIKVNQSDPDDVIIDKFFDPETSNITSGQAIEALELNPSALAIDTEGSFGGAMFMGSFGPSLGNDQDGMIFQVDANGDLTEFVTAFVDSQGAPVMFDGQGVTGFFDITDIAFSGGWGFDGDEGPYLYVLSENDFQSGGYSSDLWRVDSDGVAQLFVEDISDRVISLAFGNVGYGSDLFVSTYSSGSAGGEILRVENDGSVGVFYQFTSPYSASDLAFAPADSIMEGAMVFTLKSSTSALLMEFGPGTTQSNPDFYVWTTGLDSGDVSSGDLIFTDNGNLIVGCGGAENLTQLHYQGLFDYTFEDIGVRPILVEAEEEGGEPEMLGYAPYVLLSIVEQGRIVGLGAAFDPDEPEVDEDAATEVGPDTLDADGAGGYESGQVAFTFDGGGDIYVYIQNTDTLRTSSRGEDETPDDENVFVEGNFADFTTLLDDSVISETTDLIDAQIFGLAWGPDGSLLALGRNGDEPAEGEEPPSQIYDDTILRLGNTTDGNWQEAEALSGVAELTRLQVGVNGPNLSAIVAAGPNLPVDESWYNLDAGTYTVAISALTPAGADYELLISQGGELQRTITFDQQTGTVTLTNADNKEIEVTYNGSGRAELTVNQKPNGKILNMSLLDIIGSNYGSSLDFAVVDGDAEFPLDEIILGGSLGRLVFPCALGSLEAGQGSFGIVGSVELGLVQNVQAEGFRFFDFQADGLGDAEIAGRVFDAGSAGNLVIDGDINNVTFFDENSFNYYRNITVKGVINSSTFYGRAIDSLLINNTQQQDSAVSGSSFNINSMWGFIRNISVSQGDVVESNIYGGRRIDYFEICDGNLEQSVVSAQGSFSSISRVIVERLDDTDAESGGNVIDSLINATGWLGRLYVEGDVSSGSQINAGGYMFSRINRIASGGDFGGSINSTWINEMLIGYESDGTARAEDDQYSGSDFTGSVSAVLGLTTLSVTGSIDGANIYSSTGSIYNVFAEDGCTDTTVSAAQFISRIIVGYVGGLRSYGSIANYDADVSGNVTAQNLGRIYYTGDDAGLNVEGVRRLGPIVDDIASVSIDDMSIVEGNADLVVFTVSLSQVSLVPIVVDYATTDSSATASEVDYEQCSGTLVFPFGVTSQTIEVVVSDDNTYEQDETFFVDLSGGVNTFIEDSRGQATIVNDEQAPTVAIGDVSKVEGDSGSTVFEFEVSISAEDSTSLPITVDYSTSDDTAILADNDYQSAGGTLTFEPGGPINQIVEVLVNGDGGAEDDETFFVNLSGVTNATVTKSQGIGTVQDDDS